MNTTPPMDRPLSGAAKLIMMASAAGTIALFYLFISASMALLGIWILLELVVTVALARFGLGGLVLKYVHRDGNLLTLLGKALWLRRGTEFRLRLTPAEAPGIMAIIQRLCTRLEIPQPHAIFLEMNAGAWVELKGLHQKLGRTHVGVGYDLLAGLTEKEVEAVLAHELAHAKLITRAFRNWLSAGLARAVTASRHLSAVADAHRRAGQSFTFAELLLRGADALTRWCARMVSAYSRQDEFEADHGAAMLVGAAPLRSSLLRLEILHPVLARLPWNERLAQIQSEPGLSRWLVAELAQAAANPQEEPEVYDRYSTHPATRDRLAALPSDGSTLTDSPNGLGLLAKPDEVALKLVEEIDRRLLEAERKDHREVRSWLRKLRGGRPIHFRAAQIPGVIFLIAGFIFGLGVMGTGNIVAAAATAGGLFAVGGILLYLVRYRDRQPLPRPDFAALKASWQKRPDKELQQLQDKLEAELLGLITAERKPSRRAALLAREAYAALEKCDYLRAHVAARLCRNNDPKSVEGSLALAVASAAFQQGDQANAALDVALQANKLRSPATRWAATWATILLGGWLPAEALLEEALRKEPDEPTLLALMAFVQSRRGKRQSAIAHLCRVCQSAAAGPEPIKLLVELLLDRGALREADYWLGRLPAASRDDREVQFSRLRLLLLQRRFEAAATCLKEMAALEIPGDLLTEIGVLYESARRDSEAAEQYHQALTRGHYPAALLGLARLAARAADKARARGLVLAALDITKPVGEGSVGPQQVFQDALAQLAGLEAPRTGYLAWIGSLPLGHEAGSLKRRSMMVYAANEQEAEAHLRAIREAMEPGKPPLTNGYFELKPAPGDLQPVHPVRPGVQHVYD